MQDLKEKQMAEQEKEIQENKTKSEILQIPKFEDATDAGTPFSKGCTLFITEGDFGKTIAQAGLAVLGRNKFGIFPVRGKLMNAREMSRS